MEDSNYIVPELNGRLGNNLFMVANAFARGKELNKQVILAREQVIYDGQDYSRNIFKNFVFTPTFEDAKKYDPIICSGYFQSEKYFENYKSEIKQLFGPPEEFIDRIRLELPILFNKRITVINIRRGDYLNMPNFHPTVTPEYVYEALKHISDTEHYLIVSDDPYWCIENIKVEPFTLLTGYAPHEQLWVMSLCHNFVISNSSFSWWAAYLSNNKGVIVAPGTWFGPWGFSTWDYIYCNEWIVLPTEFKDGLIYPK